jgi:hypothetical protein
MCALTLEFTSKHLCVYECVCVCEREREREREREIVVRRGIDERCNSGSKEERGSSSLLSSFPLSFAFPPCSTWVKFCLSTILQFVLSSFIRYSFKSYIEIYKQIYSQRLMTLRVHRPSVSSSCKSQNLLRDQ